MARKLEIYLCDFVHNYLGLGTWMFPLNIGYLAAYAKEQLPNDVEVRLFKYPDEFIAAFKKSPPDLAGLAHYSWNADLNARTAAWVKKHSANIPTVFGGPNINHSVAGHKSFFAACPDADFYVPYQGETPFINLLKRMVGTEGGIPALKERPIDGVLIRGTDGSVMEIAQVPAIKELDAIPSPYLTGVLDEFFDTQLIPILETNRGCPYQCTFCAQGIASKHKLDFFGMDRIKEELRYVARKVKNTNILNFADSNFGIVKRDLEISRFIADLSKETKYPRKFNTNWAKNQPELFEIARILSNCNLVVSLQSLDEEVLDNVKRKNIKLSVFRDVINKVNAAGGISGTEIILGLPVETKESHIKTLQKMFGWDVSYIICYNALLLEGTEMSMDRENGRFPCATKFRLIDNSYGRYDDILSFEPEEGIRSTPAMSEEDILFFRPVHWMIQFLWNYRFYYDMLRYLQSVDVNPLDFILKVIEDSKKPSCPAKVRVLFEDLTREAKQEWFDSPEELRKFYSDPKEFQRLKDGWHGKLNGKYIFRTILEAREEFQGYLADIAAQCVPESRKKVVADIADFTTACAIDVSGGADEMGKERELRCSYDILEWKKAGYPKGLEERGRPDGITYRIYLPEEQKTSLCTLLKQYKHANMNVTLRKMSEFMDIRDLFYKVDPAASLAGGKA